MEETSGTQEQSPLRICPVLGLEGGWDREQVARLQRWCDGLLAADATCPLAGEGVGRHLTALVFTQLRNKETEQRNEEEMTVSEYVSAFRWMRDDYPIAPPMALLPPEERQRKHLDGDEVNEVPYLHDYVLGRTEAGLALLLDLTQPSLPPFLEDWPSRYDLSLGSPHSLKGTTRPFAYLFVGPRGARSTLHTDDHATHGWLLQLAGRKKVWLWPPGAFPYHKHTPIELELEPWHMLYIPFRWAHEVVALEDSVSVQWRYLCPECPDVPSSE